MDKIAVTMGEPGGVGPEVIVKALSSAAIKRSAHPVVVGDPDVIREAVRLSGLSAGVRSIKDIGDSRPENGVIEVLQVKARVPAKKGGPSGAAGRAVVAYIRKAVSLAVSGRVKAIVTAPISKESLHLAGYTWPGHTELLAELTHARNVSMMFVSDRLKVILSTIHIALKDVPRKITRRLVYRTIIHAQSGARMLGIRDPEIAVSGLNPHAGEAGIMGKEENVSIIPAVSMAQQEGIRVSGPYPPDVVFHRAYRGDFDIIVCMYHDQGLIPFKMLSFDSGVNMTVGLPVIRTSPDHGTAFDIAWKNSASPTSMIEAVKLASRIIL